MDGSTRGTSRPARAVAFQVRRDPRKGGGDRAAVVRDLQSQLSEAHAEADREVRARAIAEGRLAVAHDFLQRVPHLSGCYPLLRGCHCGLFDVLLDVSSPLPLGHRDDVSRGTLGGNTDVNTEVGG